MDTIDTEEESQLDDFEAQFVSEYLVDKCKAAAALRCGTPWETRRNKGCDVYKRPHVREAIRKALEEQATRNKVEADRVLQEQVYIAFSDIREIRIRDDGTIDCTTETGRAIQEINIDRTTRTHEDGTTEVNIKAKVKLYNKQQALSTLMTHLGLLIEENPPLELLLNRLPPKYASVLRMLIANPSKMPARPEQPAIVDKPNPEPAHAPT